MSDITPLRAGQRGGFVSGPAVPPPGRETESPRIFFERAELNAILAIYGRMVAAGEWRDYAIAGLKDHAVFAVFRRTSEMPLYRIEKRPKLARRQGAYAVIAASGQVLRRGHELPAVLKVLERKALRLVTTD